MEFMEFQNLEADPIDETRRALPDLRRFVANYELPPNPPRRENFLRQSTSSAFLVVPSEPIAISTNVLSLIMDGCELELDSPVWMYDLTTGERHYSRRCRSRDSADASYPHALCTHIEKLYSSGTPCADFHDRLINQIQKEKKVCNNPPRVGSIV